MVRQRVCVVADVCPSPPMLVVLRGVVVPRRRRRAFVSRKASRLLGVLVHKVPKMLLCIVRLKGFVRLLKQARGVWRLVSQAPSRLSLDDALVRMKSVWVCREMLWVLASKTVACLKQSGSAPCLGRVVWYQMEWMEFVYFEVLCPMVDLVRTPRCAREINNVCPLRKKAVHCAVGCA